MGVKINKISNPCLNLIKNDNILKDCKYWNAQFKYNMRIQCKIDK
jgi:hypothetical protein